MARQAQCLAPARRNAQCLHDRARTRNCPTRNPWGKTTHSFRGDRRPVISFVDAIAYDTARESALRRRLALRTGKRREPHQDGSNQPGPGSRPADRRVAVGGAGDAQFAHVGPNHRRGRTLTALRFFSILASPASWVEPRRIVRSTLITCAGTHGCLGF